MSVIYSENSANFPRMATDSFFVDYNNLYSYNDILNDTFEFIEDFQLLDRELWARFVNQFKLHSDTDKGWRGEFWGKMMRGGCFVYSYTKNEQLYSILEETIKDMLDAQEESGRISSYPIEIEFDSWDIWCRKYVLLGMQYFLEICTDADLYNKIIASMCAQVDYIMQYVGEGKKPITKTTRIWRGLNSSSILEPIVRLYSLTKEEKYLNYAKYIVDIGATEIENIFELAYKNEFYPYQYPVTKAYEMISCFEGLLEYYRITGEEKYKTAIINFADKLLESDFTVIGSCGCTHELFDHSTVRQANTTNGALAQETCVTVTIMKFLYQVHILTGDSKYIDAFETSLYNAYLGAVNTEKSTNKVPDKNKHFVEPLPFDSYSPLTANTRGNGVGGKMIMPDSHHYGCCACIGSAGIGLLPKTHLLKSKDGLVLNLFINGTVVTSTLSGKKLTIATETDYPKNGKVTFTLSLENSEKFTLYIRNPEWSKNTVINLNGQSITPTEGYIIINRTWNNGDKIELDLELSVKAIRPIPYGSQVVMTNINWDLDYVLPFYDREDPIAHKHIALKRGPIMLAQENRLGYSVDEPIDIKINADDTISADLSAEKIAPYPTIIELKVPLTDGSQITVTDYASAGKLWNEESKMAVWMLTK